MLSAVHNQQITLGTSSHEYQLALQADQGTVLDSHTTPALSTGGSQTFTLTALVPVGTSRLYIRGGRATGSGTALVHIGATFHLQAEIDAANVDVNTGAFNRNLNSGDNTLQEVADKFDNYMPSYPSHTASQIRTSTSGFNGNLNSGDTNVQNALDALDNLTLGLTETTITFNPHSTLNINNVSGGSATAKRIGSITVFSFGLTFPLSSTSWPQTFNLPVNGFVIGSCRPRRDTTHHPVPDDVDSSDFYFERTNSSTFQIKATSTSLGVGNVPHWDVWGIVISP